MNTEVMLSIIAVVVVLAVIAYFAYNKDTFIPTPTLTCAEMCIRDYQEEYDQNSCINQCELDPIEQCMAQCVKQNQEYCVQKCLP